MKLLTIAIPCYNSQDYMEKCVQSLLPGGEEVEILIVDDGSKDRTAEIADRLEKEHSGIVGCIVDVVSQNGCDVITINYPENAAREFVTHT